MVKLVIVQITRYHGVVGDSTPTGHTFENAESGLALAIAHEGGDFPVPFDNIGVGNCGLSALGFEFPGQ